MRQLIIARKDLDMSPGKLAAQVSHASMAFLTTLIKNNAHKLELVHFYCSKVSPKATEPMLYKRDDLTQWAKEAFERGEDGFYAKPVNPLNPYGELELCEPSYCYSVAFPIGRELYEGWINGAFTKTVCEARNRNQLMRAVELAKELGLREGIDYFLIKDNCLTELEPEEVDEDGTGRTLTCIGFRPLPDDIAHKISKKFQLYR